MRTVICAEQALGTPSLGKTPALSFKQATTKFTRVWFGHTCWAREGIRIRYAQTTETPEFNGGKSYEILKPHNRVETTKDAREEDLPHLLTIAVGDQIRHWLAEGTEIYNKILTGHDSHYPEAVYHFYTKGRVCRIFREDTDILLAKVYPDRSSLGPTAFGRFAEKLDLIVYLG